MQVEGSAAYLTQEKSHVSQQEIDARHADELNYWRNSKAALNVTKARYTLATKSKGRSTFGRQKSPTFDKVDRDGDNVYRDKLLNSTLSPVCTDGRRSRNFMNINEDRLVKVTAQHLPNMTDQRCADINFLKIRI